MPRRPGRIVECKDGKIGRTYNDLPLVTVPATPSRQGEELPPTVSKVQVFVFAESREDMHVGKLISPPENRLCLPTDLKIIGYAD